MTAVAEARRDGYAVAAHEVIEDEVVVAVALTDAARRPFGALHVAGEARALGRPGRDRPDPAGADARRRAGGARAGLTLSRSPARAPERRTRCAGSRSRSPPSSACWMWRENITP